MDLVSRIKTENDKASFNSGKRLAAHTVSLYGNGSNRVDPLRQLWSDTVEKTRLSVTDKAVIELQMFYGLRISEVLNITPYDVKPTGHIIIKGLKGSHDRIIIPRFTLSFWMQSRLALPLVNNGYSRFYFYRLYKKHGFLFQSDGSTRASVTHSFRHLLVQRLRKAGLTKEDISLLTGHKNISNTEYYGTGKGQ